MDNLADMIKQAQKHIPDDPEQLKRDLLHCLRRGVAPQLWQIKFEGKA
jgi:hypothetical protein